MALTCVTSSVADVPTVLSHSFGVLTACSGFVSQNSMASRFRNLQKLHLCLFSLIPVLSDHERVILGQGFALESDFLMIFD